ncbi:MAG: hypothetical protein IKI20_02930 [Lachnospiraceae bacterium]|nr:hypothetical protein [Lachnospiraceae bacterium]
MSAHRNDKEDLLKAAKVELVNRFILTRKMHRFYAAETFRIFHKKWSNTVFAVGLIVSAGGIIGTVMLPGFWKIPGVVFLLFGLYFLFMSKFGYLFGESMAYKNLEATLGTPPEMCVTFYPAFFSIKTGEKPLNFYYKQITRRLEYMEMSILIVGTDSHIAHGQIIDKAAMEPKDLERYYDVLERAGILPE